MTPHDAALAVVRVVIADATRMDGFWDLLWFDDSADEAYADRVGLCGMIDRAVGLIVPLPPHYRMNGGQPIHDTRPETLARRQFAHEVRNIIADAQALIAPERSRGGYWLPQYSAYDDHRLCLLGLLLGIIESEAA